VAPTRQTAAANPGLETPLQFIKGVGPQRAAQLAKKGLHTVADALFFVPLRHEDRTRLTPIRAVVPGDVVTVEGTVSGVSPPPPGRMRHPLKAVVSDGSARIVAAWFGQRYLARTLERGQRLVLHGKVDRFQSTLTLTVADFEIVEGGDDDRLHTGRLVPVYSATEGLTQRPLRRLMWNIVEKHAGDVPEMLPDALRALSGD
jgi:ATP-dependent DNA helicase RecG